MRHFRLLLCKPLPTFDLVMNRRHKRRTGSAVKLANLDGVLINNLAVLILAGSVFMRPAPTKRNIGDVAFASLLGGAEYP